MTSYFTYMLRCADQTFYTGWTTCLEKRLAMHNAGKGSKYTRSRRPVELAAFWTFENQSDAMRFEWDIKQKNRTQKEKLILPMQTDVP